MDQEILLKMYGPGAEFEMGPVTVRHGVTYPMAYLRGPQTLREYYDRHTEIFRDREFIVYEDERYTFGQVEAIARDLSSAFAHEFGIVAGDRVSIASRNYPEWCFAFVAATSMGAVVVPLNSLGKEDEYAYGLKDSGAKVLVCDEERYAMSKAACDSLGVKAIVARHKGADAPPGAVSFWAAVQAGSGRPAPAANVDTDDACCIFYTSGTTGNPKGVVQTHRALVSQQMYSAMRNEAYKSLKTGKALTDFAQSCMIIPVPLFHVTASHVILLPSYSRGGKVVLMVKWDVLKALRLIERERATNWTGVPTMLQDLMEHPDFDKYDTSSLQSVGGGGGPTPAAQVAKRASKFKGAAPGQGYGLTETNGGVISISGEEYIKHPTSIGKPFPIVEVQIRDVETRKPLPLGQPGEIWIKSPLNMKEYYNKPDKTADVLDADGWFASGDVGRVDEEGYVYIMDRAKDLIIRGGENISCAEVEGAFDATGKVLECAAFGIPDERLGEVVGLAVVPAAGHAGVTTAELRSAVVDRIAAFKVPDAGNIIISQELLPRGSTEKIQKREIRDKVVAERAAAKKQSKL